MCTILDKIDEYIETSSSEENVQQDSDSDVTSSDEVTVLNRPVTVIPRPMNVENFNPAIRVNPIRTLTFKRMQPRHGSRPMIVRCLCGSDAFRKYGVILGTNKGRPNYICIRSMMRVQSCQFITRFEEKIDN